MTLQMMDGTLEYRMSNVEAGLQKLDGKVEKLDKKIDHLGNVQMEMFDEQNRFSTEFRGSLADQREEFIAWRQSIRTSMGSNYQYWACIGILIIWTILMILHF